MHKHGSCKLSIAAGHAEAQAVHAQRQACHALRSAGYDCNCLTPGNGGFPLSESKLALCTQSFSGCL